MSGDESAINAFKKEIETKSKNKDGLDKIYYLDPNKYLNKSVKLMLEVREMLPLWDNSDSKSEIIDYLRSLIHDDKRYASKSINLIQSFMNRYEVK